MGESHLTRTISSLFCHAVECLPSIYSAEKAADRAQRHLDNSRGRGRSSTAASTSAITVLFMNGHTRPAVANSEEGKR